MRKRRQSIITPPPVIPVDSQAAPMLSDEDKEEGLLKLIRKGAPSVPKEEVKSDAEKEVKFTLRFQQSMAERVKRAAAGRPIPTSINRWWLEAGLEKLKKEGF